MSWKAIDRYSKDYEELQTKEKVRFYKTPMSVLQKTLEAYDALAAKIRALRNHGMEPRYYHKWIGGNFRIDAIQSAVLAVKLPHLDAWGAGRRKNAKRYRAGFVARGLDKALGEIPEERLNVNGGAIALGHPLGASGTLTFVPGVTTRQIAVSILDDNLAEADETFFIDLSSPVNATVADAQGRGTISGDSNTPGDQPALICEHVDWARAAGFKVVAAGKGTRYEPHYHRSNPDNVWDILDKYLNITDRKSINPKMFNSFVDGTKSGIEMTAVCNATGLVPQSDGLSFPPATRFELAEVCKPKSAGGTLEKEGVTEVTSSVYRDGRDVPHHLALGTYVVIEGETDYARRCFKEYAMLPDSSGRYAALYRPIHMIGLELGIEHDGTVDKADGAVGGPLEQGDQAIKIEQYPHHPAGEDKQHARPAKGVISPAHQEQGKKRDQQGAPIHGAHCRLSLWPYNGKP